MGIEQGRVMLRAEGRDLSKNGKQKIKYVLREAIKIQW